MVFVVLQTCSLFIRGKKKLFKLFFNYITDKLDWYLNLPNSLNYNFTFSLFGSNTLSAGPIGNLGNEPPSGLDLDEGRLLLGIVALFLGSVKWTNFWGPSLCPTKASESFEDNELEDTYNQKYKR